MKNLLENFQKRLITNNLAEDSIKAYIQNFGRFAKAKNINELSDLTTDKVMEYCAEQRSLGGQAKANMIVNAIRKFIELFDLKDIKTPKTKKSVRLKEPVPITEEELSKLVNYIKQEEFRYSFRVIAALAFMFYTGARVSEICRLKREHFTEGRYVKVWLKKQNKYRHILLIKSLRDLLGEYFSLEGEDFNAFNMTKRAVRYYLKELINIREVLGKNRNAFPHLMRHSMITHYHDKGIDIKDIAELVGHSDIKHTETYIKSNPDVLRKKVDDKIKGLVLC